MVPIKLARFWSAYRGQNALLTFCRGLARRERRPGKQLQSDPVRMAFANLSFGDDFDVTPVSPPCELTPTEMNLRRTSSAADAVSAVRAAAVDPRGPASPASIAPREVSALPHSHGGGEGLYP